MTSVQQPGASPDTPWLIELVAECLKVSPSCIDRHVPLARYGLDSLAAIQLMIGISTKLQSPVPDALLLHYPSLDALELFLQSFLSADPLDHFVFKEDASPLDRMLADSILPPDILPCKSQPSESTASSILLTGATGFLGGYLLRALLRDTQASIYVLVRDSGADAVDRVRMNLQQYGIWDSKFESRLHIVEGDLRLPQVGISERDYAFLSSQTLVRQNPVHVGPAMINFVYLR